MNLPDLRVFVCASRLPTLGAAAQALHLTPSAVSKALRRLEENLGHALFDRSGKQLVLNPRGQLLLARAQDLLALADQTRADLMGDGAALDSRIGGPAILLWRHAAAITQALQSYPAARQQLSAMFEQDALAALARGDLTAAIVTRDVIEGRGGAWSEDWQVTPLGTVTLQLTASVQHPLVARLAASAAGVGGIAGVAGMAGAVTTLQASSAEVLAHDFVCPQRSLFGGVVAGAYADGWRDDQLPRKIRYWTDDLQLLMTLVKAGQALAYLPDSALDDPALCRIQVSDCGFSCCAEVVLVWPRGRAGHWQQQLAAALAASVTTSVVS